MAKPTPVTGLGPRIRVSDAAERIVAARLADVRRYERKLGARVLPDDIHDMRVATRRLRAALKLIGSRKSLDRMVKRFQDSLGEVRDIHVQLAWLEKTGKDADRASQAFLSIVHAHLKRQLPKLTVQLKEELKRWKTRAVPALLAAVEKVEDPHRLGGARFRKQLLKRVVQINGQMKAVIDSPDARQAHLLRISVKKLRYLAELLEPVWPDRIDALLEALQPLQDALGELHDADVREQQLTRLATLLPQSGDGVQPVLQQVADEREKLAAKAVSLILRWRRERVIRGMRQLLSQKNASVA